MKTRSILPTVRIAFLIAASPLAFSGDATAQPVDVGCFPSSLATNVTESTTRLPRFTAIANNPGFQGVLADYSSEVNPFESLRQPWYIRMWPESRALRIMMIAGIIMGIKALFSKKSGTTPTSAPQQQPVQRLSQQTTTPLPSPPTASTQPTTSGWFYHSNGSDIGPFDEAALRQMKNAGVINFATPIRPANGGNWITYANVFGSN